MYINYSRAFPKIELEVALPNSAPNHTKTSQETETKTSIIYAYGHDSLTKYEQSKSNHRSKIIIKVVFVLGMQMDLTSESKLV